MTKEVFGSQRLLQIAVNSRPELVASALKRSGAVGRREEISWLSPLDQNTYAEYRDGAALSKLGITQLLTHPLATFWPSRGCVWDGLALASGRPVLVEAKAHIPEAVSPPSKATSTASADLIAASLGQARRFYGPRGRTTWGAQFYQYTNRLAYQYFLREKNSIASSLVFLYFTNASDMEGTTTDQEWQGAV